LERAASSLKPHVVLFAYSREPGDSIWTAAAVAVVFLALSAAVAFF
jgi:hypothetical protein